jgi:hypothetical protein
MAFAAAVRPSRGSVEGQQRRVAHVGEDGRRRLCPSTAGTASGSTVTPGIGDRTRVAVSHLAAPRSGTDSGLGASRAACWTKSAASRRQLHDPWTDHARGPGEPVGTRRPTAALLRDP